MISVTETLNDKRETYRAQIRRQQIQSAKKSRRKEFMMSYSPATNNERLSHLHTMMVSNQIVSVPHFNSELATILSGQLQESDDILVDFLKYSLASYQEFKWRAEDGPNVKLILEIVALIAYETQQTALYSREILDMVKETLTREEYRSQSILLLTNLSYIQHDQSIGQLCQQWILECLMDLVDTYPLGKIEKQNLLGVYLNLVASESSDIDLLCKYISIVDVVIQSDDDIQLSQGTVEVLKQMVGRKPEVLNNFEFQQILVSLLRLDVEHKNKLLKQMMSLLARVVDKDQPHLMSSLMTNGLLFLVLTSVQELDAPDHRHSLTVLVQVVQAHRLESIEIQDLTLMYEICRTVLSNFDQYGTSVLRELTLQYLSKCPLKGVVNSKQFVRLLENMSPCKQSIQSQLFVMDLVENMPIESVHNCQYMEEMVTSILNQLANSPNQSLSLKAANMLDLTNNPYP